MDYLIEFRTHEARTNWYRTNRALIINDARCIGHMHPNKESIQFINITRAIQREIEETLDPHDIQHMEELPNSWPKKAPEEEE